MGLQPERKRERELLLHISAAPWFSQQGVPWENQENREREAERERAVGSNISSSMSLSIDAAPCMPAVCD